MINRGSSDRAVSPAIATLFLVAVVLVLGAAVGAQLLGITEKIGGPTAEATFEYDESPVGVEMTPEQIGQDVTVEINGKPVETFDTDDAGNGKLIPTSPGDELTVVAADNSRSVLVSKTIDDRDEIGDFIAHYTFEEGSGNTLYDQSGNDNEGEINGADWLTGSDTGLKFDGDDDVHVSDLDAGVDVSEFTIAVAYKTNTGNKKQELVEHISGPDNWGLELKPEDADTHRPLFFAGKNRGSQSDQLIAGDYNIDGRHVLVGTYDGSQNEVFFNGESKKTGTFDSEINMNEMHIGKDAEGNFDHLDGEIYEIRLYYSEFDEGEVKSITKAMS